MSANAPSWEIRWARAALVGFRRLPTQDQRSDDAARERFAATGYGDIVRVVVPEDQLRSRVGNWRIRFRTWQEQVAPEAEIPGRRIVEVLVVRHRNAAYRDV